MSVAAVFGALALGSASPIATPATDQIEAAVFTDCLQILRREAHVVNAREMSVLGYRGTDTDDEGVWASKPVPGGTLRIGTAEGKPGCMLRFTGADAASTYEIVLSRLLGRGFLLPNGKRKAAERQFVLDTLVSHHPDIGLLSMFRVNSVNADSFAMTVYPPIPEPKR